MTTEAKPQKTKITLQHDNRHVAVIAVDFQDARRAGLIVFNGNQYVNSGMVYDLKDGEHDDPAIDWRGHLLFDRVGDVLVVPDNAEIKTK